MADDPVLIIGAGLAGLACAHHLHAAGVHIRILEAGDGVGGRVRSDIVDGFVLDRGFQVLLTAYPEARRMLDYNALSLQSFYPGALVQLGSNRHLVADPVRRTMDALRGATAPIGSLLDKARVGLLRLTAVKKNLDDLWAAPETTTIERLQRLRFSPKIIERFFRPLFGGIFLEDDLATSSRMFDFVFRMLADGDNAFPAGGMQAIPDQLAAALPPGTIQLGARVGAIDGTRVTLLDHEVIGGRAIVVATEGPQAAKLLGGAIDAPASVPVSCLYYAASKPPIHDKAIVLNGRGVVDGPVNNLCVPTNVSGQYATGNATGGHLVSATVLGNRPRAFDPVTRAAHDTELDAQVRTQMRGWFGAEVDGWQYLRSYHIHHAQPAQRPPALTPHERSVTVRPGVFVAGDHRDQASINGALTSGRRAAEAVLASLS